MIKNRRFFSCLLTITILLSGGFFSCSKLLNFNMPEGYDAGGDGEEIDIQQDDGHIDGEPQQEVDSFEDIQQEDGIDAIEDEEIEVPPTCGDGHKDEGEECDDGNTNDTDGCKSDCTYTCHVETQATNCNDNHNCTTDTCDPLLHTCSNTLSTSTVACRPAAGVCDIAEYCDGIHPDCPEDSMATTAIECRPAAGACDIAEYCDGTHPDCPANVFAQSGVECRPAAGICDVPEYCSGTSPNCPTDELAGTTVECRQAAGQCDVAEFCDGIHTYCPNDQLAEDETECNDSNPCTINDICTSGECRGNLAGEEVCNYHGTCVPTNTPPCTCDEGYTGNFCQQCDEGYVEDPQNPGTCIIDPCTGVTCNGADTCNDTYTAIVRVTGVCIPTGEGTYTCETTQISCAPGVCVSGSCVAAGTPAEGDLIINEIMIDPHAVTDENGQYFEIFNKSSSALNISGTKLRTQNSSGTWAELTIPLPPVILQQGDYYVVARNSNSSLNGGFDADIEFSSMVLERTSGSIQIVSPDSTTIIDSVTWDSSWPMPTGVSQGFSMTFSIYALQQTNPASMNDNPIYWCHAQSQWTSGSDYGSPGSVNQTCEVDDCAIVRPVFTTAVASYQTEDIFGQAYEHPITTYMDTPSNIIAQLGFGPQGTIPDDRVWTWFPTTYDPGFPPGQIIEEFVGKILAPNSPGTYDYAYRMSLDGGLSWKLCDRDGGEYTSAQAGLLTVNPTTLFFSEYIEGSSNNKALEIFNPFQSTVSLDTCRIRIYYNGNPSPGTTINLTGFSIPSRDVFVVCNSSAASEILSVCDLQNTSVNFNGDDAVELNCDSNPVDIIGKIGEDPGTEWGTGNQSTADNTLVRKCNISSGDSNGSDSFDPAAQWDGYPIDTFTYLNSHTTCY